MAAKAQLLRGLRVFWRWWSGELAALWPGRQGGVAESAIWDLEPIDGQLALHAGSDDARYLIDPDDEDMDCPPGVRVPSRAVVLRVDPTLAMLQRVDLPLAAEENLRQVLTYQMDRETPFTAEQVFFDFRVIERDRTRQQLGLELAVLPRRLLDPVFERLRCWGVAVRAVQVPVAGGGAPFNLSPADRRQGVRRGRRARRLPGRRHLLPAEDGAGPRRLLLVFNGILALLAVGLLGVGLALPLLEKQRIITALEPQLAAARRAALVANGLRDEIAQATERLDLAVREKRVRVKLLDVLQEITRLLPDDTWLQELEVTGTEVQMRGETPSAAQLVGLLEASERLRNARFRSPVTPSPVSGRERFHLSVEVQQGDAS